MINTSHVLKKLTFLAALSMVSSAVSAQPPSPDTALRFPAYQPAFPRAEGLVTPTTTRIPVLVESRIPMFPSEKEQSSEELLLPVANMDTLPEFQALGARECFFRAKLPASDSAPSTPSIDYLKCFGKDGKALGEGHLVAHIEAGSTKAHREALVLDGGVIRWTTF